VFREKHEEIKLYLEAFFFLNTSFLENDIKYFFSIFCEENQNEKSDFSFFKSVLEK
jgi:hypothetical protein